MTHTYIIHVYLDKKERENQLGNFQLDIFDLDINELSFVTIYKSPYGW